MYQIGTLNIKIENLHNDQPLERLVSFRTDKVNHLQIVYDVLYCDKLFRPQTEQIIYQTSDSFVTKENNKIRYFHVYQKIPYAITEKISLTYYKIYLSNDVLAYNVHPYFFLDLLHLEVSLIKQNCFVLHSSYLSIEDGAILFTAPSGGGKSTQAELWKKYKNAEIINGDKSIIGKEGEEWKAYGIPFSGSSEYCQNKTFPLKAIVILDKGPINQFSQVGIRGFSNVFSQITINPWDKEFCEKAMNLVIDVCNEVPIYYYSCTKTKEAVDILYQEFIEKGILNGTV